MAKLGWKAFIAKHQNDRHIVTTGTQPRLFKKPTGIASKNQKKWPGIPDIIKEALGSKFAGDWAHERELVPSFRTSGAKTVRVRPASLYKFIFSDAADASLAARLLKSASNRPQPSPDPAFASLTRGSEIDNEEYKRLVTALGYL